MSTRPFFHRDTGRHRQTKHSQRNLLHRTLSRHSLTRHLKKWVISLFLLRTCVHPPTSHYHKDLSRYNLYLCSQMEDSTQELASCVCVIMLKWGDAGPCVWGWDFRPGRKEERGGVGGGGRSKKAREEREAVKLEKIWLFYARLLR